MDRLTLHDTHEGLGARFTALSETEVVADYGDMSAEYRALSDVAAVLDLSFRSRVCLTGVDRIRFLHGQVTNDVKALGFGEGCYAALITAKGRMQSDLNIYRLEDELLLDFEPGLAGLVSKRLEHYIIAEDVQVVDVAPHYGLLSVQGPRSQDVVRDAMLGQPPPEKAFQFLKVTDAKRGELYLVNQPRLGMPGFDLFVPLANLGEALETLRVGVAKIGGTLCGWNAFELRRIEAGVPRFGADIDETNIPLEAGLEKRAISFNKGCYIGQEVISRIKTYSEVAKALRGLRLADDLKTLPVKGVKLFQAGKEVGYVTSAARSPSLKANIGLGYVRKEVNQVGSELSLGQTESTVRVVELPFRNE